MEMGSLSKTNNGASFFSGQFYLSGKRRPTVLAQNIPLERQYFWSRGALVLLDRHMEPVFFSLPFSNQEQVVEKLGSLSKEILQPRMKTLDI
jgi:hypothetical protein